MMTMETKTMTVSGKSGIINDFFTEVELTPVLKYFINMPQAAGFAYGAGINEDHLMYKWFVKKVFAKIQETFGKHVQLATVNYVNEHVPVNLHSDYYHSYRDIGTPHLAMLIPITVNDSEDFSNPVHTIIFNEEDACIDKVRGLSWNKRKWEETRTRKENNAVQYKDAHLSHINNYDLECLTVQGIFEWKFGSLIYWDERLLHTSDNFTKNNIKSKQALVLHTYVL